MQCWDIILISAVDCIKFLTYLTLNIEGSFAVEKNTTKSVTYQSPTSDDPLLSRSAVTIGVKRKLAVIYEYDKCFLEARYVKNVQFHLSSR